MFLEKLIERNSRLVEFAVREHQAGRILPDSYIVDVDAFKENAEAILAEAGKHSFKLYFMLKQLGRNPYLASLLQDMGYDGAVAVDFKEACVMMENGIRLGNVGHLVQIPDSMISKVVAYGAENITVYSEEKIRRINDEAGKLGKTQGILIRVVSDNDYIYPGQTAGFDLSELPSLVEFIRALGNIRINGVTSFPCYLYSKESGDIEPTENLRTVLKAEEILISLGYGDLVINTPSTTSVRTIQRMAECGGNCGEPGHGLTGTTPLHAASDEPEIPAVLYLTEVSHSFKGDAYAYGGGHYRRSHMENALVGRSAQSLRHMSVTPPSMDSIDYHFTLSGKAEVGETVVTAFRFQVFVTRSDVVLVEGLSEGKGRIAGVYDSLGRRK